MNLKKAKALRKFLNYKPDHSAEYVAEEHNLTRVIDGKDVSYTQYTAHLKPKTPKALYRQMKKIA